MKTLVIISDLHCGAYSGITPPGYFVTKHAAEMKESWTEYTRIIDKWKNPDVLLVNGDCIDGSQNKQGGAELITTDRNVQCDIAEECISLWQPKEKIIMTYGSPYHVGAIAEDCEYAICKMLRAKGCDAEIEGNPIIDIEGFIIDARHKIGRSSIPHGQATPLLRAMMWAMINEANKTKPRVNMIVRSHTHYNLFIKRPGMRAVITPGLQLARGRFGSRECEGEIHWGALRYTIENGQIIREEEDICNLIANNPRIIKIG